MMRDPFGRAAQRLEAVGHSRVFTSVVVAAALRYGAVKKGSPRLETAVEATLSVLPVLALDVPADRAYGHIRAELQASGQPIGMNDLLIASQARALDLVLVTDNLREFTRVRGLLVENWLNG